MKRNNYLRKILYSFSIKIIYEYSYTTVLLILVYCYISLDHKWYIETRRSRSYSPRTHETTITRRKFKYRLNIL